MSDTVILINRHSSGSRAALERLPELLDLHGIAYDDLIVANDHERLCRRVKNAIKSGAKRLIVGGGDGTMASAMQYLAHSKTTLGLLPLGTGNSFSQTMQIPHDLDAAIKIIGEGRVARVDLGRVNDTYFANFATIGLAAEIAHETPNDLKSKFGPLAYAIAGVGPMLKSQAFEARLKWDGQRQTMRTQQIVVASGRFFGHQPLTPDASIVDGKLSVYVDTGTTPLDVAKTYAALAIGQQTKLADSFTLATSKITVKTDTRQPISVDGDEAGYTPARFRIEARALRIFVSPAFLASVEGSAGVSEGAA
jgi:diacylglycerol kinase (ATP)